MRKKGEKNETRRKKVQKKNPEKQTRRGQ